VGRECGRSGEDSDGSRGRIGGMLLHWVSGKERGGAKTNLNLKHVCEYISMNE